MFCLLPPTPKVHHKIFLAEVYRDWETYKAIEAGYKMVRKATNIEDAKNYLDIVYRKKAFASDIEVELLRREINRGKEE